MAKVDWASLRAGLIALDFEPCRANAETIVQAIDKGEIAEFSRWANSPARVHSLSKGPAMLRIFDLLREIETAIHAAGWRLPAEIESAIESLEVILD